MTRKTIPAILFMFVALVSTPLTGGAATVGNIASSQGGGGGVSVGVEYDRVFERELNFDTGDRIRNNNGVVTTVPFPASGESINDLKLESNRVLVKGTLGFNKDIDLDLFIKVGVADVIWKASHVTATGTQDLKFDGNADFAWGGGAKFGFYHFTSGLKIMGDIQYLTYTVKGTYSINGIDRAVFETPASYDTKTRIEEYQGALYVQQFFGAVGPYLGAKYSNLTLKNETNVSGSASGVPYTYDETMKAKAKNNVGAFLGADFNIQPNHLSVNVEVRLIDETSGTIGVNYKF
jgi:hypothetical protein